MQTRLKKRPFQGPRYSLCFRTVSPCPIPLHLEAKTKALSGHGDSGAKTQAAARDEPRTARAGGAPGPPRRLLRSRGPRAQEGRPRARRGAPDADRRPGVGRRPGGRKPESRPGGGSRGLTPPAEGRLRGEPGPGPRGRRADPPGRGRCPAPPPRPPCGRRSPGGVRDIPDEQGGVGGPRVARHGGFLCSLSVCPRPPGWLRPSPPLLQPQPRPPAPGATPSPQPGVAQPQRRARRAAVAPSARGAGGVRGSLAGRVRGAGDVRLPESAGMREGAALEGHGPREPAEGATAGCKGIRSRGRGAGPDGTRERGGAGAAVRGRLESQCAGRSEATGVLGDWRICREGARSRKGGGEGGGHQHNSPKATGAVISASSAQELGSCSASCPFCLEP